VSTVGIEAEDNGTPVLYAIAPTQFVAGTLEVDPGAMASNVIRLGALGIRRFLLTGSYGEFQSLLDDERISVLRAVIDTGAALSVMACAASPSTAATIELGRRMQDAGADLIMVAAPLVAEVSDSDIMRHFELLSQGLQGGIVVYNNPAFGSELSPTQLSRVAELPGVVGIKQGTRSLPGLVESVDLVRRTSGGSVKVFAASDLLAHVSLAAGMDGLTSTNVWAFPTGFTSLIDCARAGDAFGMRRVADAMAAYSAIVRRCGQPRVIKAAMQIRGFSGSAAVRAPYLPLHADEREGLERALKESDGMLSDLSASGTEARR
jgi:dihydrodipicolinate synthase/N-acetylneuraminate lyase